MGMIKLIYTNELGGSLVFSRDSEIHITDISGLSENSISLSESKVLNGVGTSNTGCDISSKQLQLRVNLHLIQKLDVVCLMLFYLV